MRYVFIINPTAGKGKGPESLPPMIKKAFENREEDYKIIITENAGDAEVAAKREAETGDEVCIFACGGEGTCFETVNGIIGFDNVTLGVIPCGSANDFLKFFGGKDEFLNIENQIGGGDISLDLIKANDFYSINQCSVGMDAMVADDMKLFKKLPLVSGPMAYNMAVVKTFLRKLGISIRIKIDDKYLGLKRCLFAVCANGPVYGGGYISAPEADPRDGKLEFLLVDRISRFRVPSFLKVYSSGMQHKKKYVTMGKCETMEIEADKPISVNLDGEIFHSKTVRFEIVKNAIKFRLPCTLVEREHEFIGAKNK